MISEIHGLVRLIDWQGRKILIFLMHHPTATRRNKKIALEFEKDFSKLKKTLNTLNNQSKKSKSNLKTSIDKTKARKDFKK